MNLPEYKSKELLAQYGVPVPPGKLARSAKDAEEAAASLTAKKFVVKAQISAGGRGLAGGIKFAATPSSVHDEAARMLGQPLVTDQTGPEGETVESVYIEAAEEAAAECFVAFALDFATGYPMLLASTEGGVAFEERARMDSDTVKTLVLSGDDPEKAIGDFLGTVGLDKGAAQPLALALQAFTETDMALLEMNPFAQTKAGNWLALDAKIVLDAAAAFRRPEFEALAVKDAAPNINFVPLDGDLGVIVNGAGLGLATNDMIRDAGGKPANFMDIRTTASSFDIARGVEMLLADKRVKALLLNVHGGGMTVCDTVAEGVAFAYSRSERKLPVIARLAGVNAEWGNRILTERRIPVEVFDAMKPAVARAVERAGGA